MPNYLHQILEAQQWLKKPGIIVRERGDLPAALKRKIITRKGAKCAECGSLNALTLDHRVARALGGTNDHTNLQVLCQGCNAAKNQREMHILDLLRTEAGRAEVLRWWRVTLELGALRGRIANARRTAQRELAYRILHGPKPG